MSQGLEAEISIDSQGCRGGGGGEGEQWHSSTEAALESRGLSSFGIGAFRIASPRKRHWPTVTSGTSSPGQRQV